MTLIVIVCVSVFAASLYLHVPAEPLQGSTAPFFVGVEIGWGCDVAECKAVIDRVKNYTNLLVLASPKILGNKTMLNEACDCARDAGLSFMVYFGDLEYAAFYPEVFEQYKPMDWLKEAKERYRDQFLGVYFDDEMGGKQLDNSVIYLYGGPTNYQEAADNFVSKNQETVHNLQTTLNLIPGTEVSVFTSDYALYWFDYQRGYDTVFAQFGWNNSRPLQVALARGAAKAQNKEWGAMLTWTYDQPPYLASASQLYDDMVLAYDAGAKYVAVYDATKGWHNTTLTDEHFDALKKFWHYVQQNPSKQGSLKADSALVLPRDFGCGFRYRDDSIWGFKQPDEWTRKICDDTYRILDEYNLTLDILYNDPEIKFSPEENYVNVIHWASGAENNPQKYPVLNLNNSLGYASIQEAINSRATLNGDTIRVKAGIYRENVVVNRSITLLGENRESTIIDAGKLGTVLNILSGKVTVTGFTIQNGRNLTSSGNAVGIYLNNVNDAQIIGNNVKMCDVGVLLQSSSNNTLKNNNINGNEYNFGVVGDSLPNYLNDVDSSNTVNGKPIQYLVNKTNEKVSSDAGYVALVNCDNIRVQDLQLANNYNGLLLAYTQQSSISNNVLTANYEGMRIDSSENNILRNNKMNKNGYNFIVKNPLANDINSSNKVNDKPIYYWVNEHDKTVPDDAGYVALLNCIGMVVEKLQLADNYQGILVVNTRNSTLSQNTLANHIIGILLIDSTNITVTDNELTSNQEGISLQASSNNFIAENSLTKANSAIILDASDANTLQGNKLTENAVGVFINASSNNLIQRNQIKENNFGISLQGNTFSNSSFNSIIANTFGQNQNGVDMQYGALNNTLYHNNFLNNINQVSGYGRIIQPAPAHLGSVHILWYPMPINFWDNSVTEGNFWSDYTGTDADHDGVGDTPYALDGWNQDNYPLMQPHV